MPIYVDVPELGVVEFPDGMKEGEITSVLNKQVTEVKNTKSYVDRITQGQQIKPTPDGTIPKDQTKQLESSMGTGNRDLAEDLARAGRRGIARPLVGAVKTLNDDFGANLKGTEANLEKWIGDQGPMSDWTRAVGGGVGQLPYFAAGPVGYLTAAFGGGADTRANVKRQGGTELAASGVAGLDVLSTLLAGKFLNSQKPLTSAIQNVGQEYGTSRAQQYVLDNSMTPELAEQFAPTAAQLAVAGAMGAGMPAIKRQLAQADVVRGVNKTDTRPSVIQDAQRQVEQTLNTREGLTPEGDGILLKEPVLNKGQEAIAKKLTLGEKVKDATLEIDAQRINAPQYGSEKPRLGQDQEAHGKAQDALIDKEKLVQWLETLPPEQAKKYLGMTPEELAAERENYKPPYQGDPTKSALLQDPTAPKPEETPPQTAALFKPKPDDVSEATAPKGWEKVDNLPEDFFNGVIERNRKGLSGPTVFDAIDYAVQHSPVKRFADILTRSRGVLENMEKQGIKINYVIANDPNTSAGGWVNPRKPGKELTIALNKATQGDANFEIFTHEIIHAVAIPLSQRVEWAKQNRDFKFLQENKMLVQAHNDLKAIYAAFRDDTDGPVFHNSEGKATTPHIKNMQEFIAYGMTNYRVVNWLKSKTINGTNGLMAFVKAVGKMIGIGENDINAHSELWHIFDRMTLAGKDADFTYNGKNKTHQISVLEGVYEAQQQSIKRQASTLAQQPSGPVTTRIPGLEEAAGVRFENVHQLMKAATDIKLSELGTLFRPGFRYEAWKTKHPIIQLAQSEVTYAKARANEFLRKHVTGDKGQAPTFGQIGAKLSVKELAEINEVYKIGSRNKVRIDPNAIKAFSPDQRAYLEGVYKAMDARWENANKQLKAAGLPGIPYRQGYYPGILEADFASVGVDKDGMVVAIAGDNTKWSYNKAKDWLKSQPGVAEVVEIKNAKQSNNFRQNDVLTGLLKLMKILPDTDPSLPKIKALKEQVELMTNDQLFGMHLHRLPKKGIQGFNGDRPWLSQEQNAREFHKGLINFFSKAATADELHVPLKKLNEVFGAYEKEQPNAINATRRWLGQVAGTVGNSNVSEIGRGLNMALYGIMSTFGVGPSKVRGALGMTADLTTQHVLGWFNAQFVGANFIQILQGGGPFAAWASDRLGMNPVSAGKAWTEGMTKGAILMGEYVAPGGKVKVPMDTFNRTAFDYARKMGILQFSEIERLHSESQNKYKQMYDSAAEFSMKMGEVGTRPLVFMAMANLIKQSKIGGQFPDDIVLEHAYNITQRAMTDYSPEQRPLIYSELGLAGQMLGKFGTYKHNFVGQEITLGKEALKGDPTPFLMMNGLLFALAGTLGMPFMEDALKALEAATGENYKEKLLKNMNLAGAYGILSDALGIQVSPKFSAGNIVPDGPLDSIPTISIITKAMQAVIDGGGKAIDGTFSSQDAKNIGRALTPTSMQREFDRQFNRGPNNELIGKEGDDRDYLTEKEWDARKFFGWQGNTLDEAARNAVDRESFSTNRKNEERIKGAEDSIARLMNLGELSQKAYERQLEKYIKAGGDPNTLASSIENKVSILKQPMWYRRMKKTADGPAPTIGNQRILDNPYREIK